MWFSHTGQFGEEEMTRIWSVPLPMLAEMVADASPVVALRCVAEVMLNGDTAKLTALLADQQVNAKWQAWHTDDGLDSRDQLYADQLTECLAQMSVRRVGSVEARLPEVPVLHVQIEDLNYPYHMGADDTSLWASQPFEPGTRIILRCDQVSRPYFPTASYYEVGTVTHCRQGTDGRYLIDFRHDPWPPTMYITSHDYYRIERQGVTEFEEPYHQTLDPGTPIVITGVDGRFYLWGEVMACWQTELSHYTCRVKVMPDQV